MKKRLGRIKKCANLIVQKARVHRTLLAVLAAIFLLRFYLIRELLAAGLFFALGFAVLWLLGGPAYLIGSAGLSWLERPRRSQSNAAPPVGKSGSFAERTLRPRASWWGPAVVKNADPVKPSMFLEQTVLNKKESAANVTAI
jgi:hypothetical protein